MCTEIEDSIRILLIEHQTIMRAGLRLLVDSCPKLTVVGEAGAYDDAIALAENKQPDVILLEPDMSGEINFKLIRELIAVASAARVIVLTGDTDSEMHRLSIRQGAMGLVLKDQPVETLIKAIQKVHAGEMWVERSMSASLITEMRSEGGSQKAECKETRTNALTAREREICILVAEGLNNQQIADRLYLSKATVRHHITSIFSKLEVSDRIGLLLYSYECGLVMPPRKPGRPS